MSWNQYEKQVLGHFPAKSKIASLHGGGVAITVPCKHPGCTPAPVEFKMHMPGDAAKRVFANKGWRFWGKATTCPTHSQKQKDEAMPTNDNSKPRLSAVQSRAQASDTALMAAEPFASVQAREAKRMAMLALDEQFDVAKGCYKNQYSDLKVAKEMGLSEETVIGLREEFFGPIKEPAEITELRERCAAFEAKIDGFEKQAIASHAAALEQLKGMREECSKMTGRLAALVHRNGW